MWIWVCLWWSENNRGYPFLPFLCLRQGFFCSSSHGRPCFLACELSWIFLFPFYLITGVLGLHIFEFYVGPEDMNWGAHACVAVGKALHFSFNLFLICMCVLWLIHTNVGSHVYGWCVCRSLSWQQDLLCLLSTVCIQAGSLCTELSVPAQLASQLALAIFLLYLLLCPGVLWFCETVRHHSELNLEGVLQVQSCWSGWDRAAIKLVIGPEMLA